MSVALLANIIVFLALIALLAYANRNPTWSLAKKVLLGVLVTLLFGPERFRAWCKVHRKPRVSARLRAITWAKSPISMCRN